MTEAAALLIAFLLGFLSAILLRKWRERQIRAFRESDKYPGW